jgi:hypothetical protein
MPLICRTNKVTGVIYTDGSHLASSGYARRGQGPMVCCFIKVSRGALRGEPVRKHCRQVYPLCKNGMLMDGVTVSSERPILYVGLPS